ncbi:Sushi, nidogen and EGF-like domain-containing protein 1 [Mizuhopecten yessoensis]|uniref:Sushi, nidogen and EGF-like domain-containing protein 1 n=1 Tax=Mizuhopecten yessoensis TaxID=6573 RepID=A0A210PHG7_MIZYE|nr:Sushi, nidogen and EGF-like domain-containing protein 1 [Mizuhopecten yessoensis]
MSTPCPAHYRTGCDANACLGIPCKNGGTCKTVGTTYTCACTTAYYGETCAYVDECHSNPCENGGTCTRVGSNFNCGCTNGHQGTNCQHQSPCYGQPCKNGATCQNSGTTYVCACTSGFYGVDCESVDKCLSNPCENGGTCTRVGSNFNCGCTNEHQGTNCQHQSPCYGQPCKNGATCQYAGTTYTCACTSGFYGVDCESVDRCLSNPCDNGGTCSRIGSNFNCSCTNEHQGTNCQHQSPCYGQPCKNGATCQYAGTTYTCACTSGFYGVDCKNVDACQKSPCKNGATCNRVGSDYNCSCTDRYIGSSCIEDCRPGPADIIIVLDSSTSAHIVFNKSKSFADSVVKGLSIDAGDFRIAMLTYSADVHLEFGFNTHTNKTSMLTAIDDISSSSGASYLHKALGNASEMFLSESLTGVKQYVIIISDGLSTRRQKNIVETRLLRARGVKVLCVGIGSQVAQEELLQIATATPYVFSPSNDDVLNVILMETANTNCTDCLINKVSDIVLLVDVSKYQSAQLQRTLDIVRFFIHQVRTYFSDTRIAMVTFDGRQHVKFGLTDDQETDGILVKSQIGITTYDRESDVKAALAFVRTSVLSGARGTSRNFVVVFSNEEWTDVDGIVRERQALNMDNVTVAFVPVGLPAELDTVYSVAYQESDVYYVGNNVEDHDEERLKALIAQTSHVECVNDLFDKRQ